MQDLEKNKKESNNIEEYSAKYFDYLCAVMKRMDKRSLAVFVDELRAARKEGKTVFIIGNGGSAATASHMANDFAKAQICRVLSLTDNISHISAIANDENYDDIFVSQLRGHFRQGDILIAISASGNSPNLIKAVEWVKEHGGKTIGLLGFDGGKLRELCDLSVLVKTPKGEYGPVEDIHLVIGHLASTWLCYRLAVEDIDKGPFCEKQ